VETTGVTATEKDLQDQVAPFQTSIWFCEPQTSIQYAMCAGGISLETPRQYSHFFYIRLFIEIIHEPLSLEESTLAEDNSLQAQAYLVLDRREEVRQAP